MAISQALCTSFKQEILVAEHDLTASTGNTIKAALYTSSATLGATTTAYSATNETSGAGYSAGGVALTNVTPTLSGTTALTDWADATWSTATITARGALIYNDTHGSNASILVLDFGSNKSASAGDFTIQFPAADASNAIIRIA
tara:strand:+ start:1195 stop:1626 length:432 start_codon:yes stop_codon:yes gene_type:complete